MAQRPISGPPRIEDTKPKDLRKKDSSSHRMLHRNALPLRAMEVRYDKPPPCLRPKPSILEGGSWNVNNPGNKVLSVDDEWGFDGLTDEKG